MLLYLKEEQSDGDILSLLTVSGSGKNRTWGKTPFGSHTCLGLDYDDASCYI